VKVLLDECVDWRLARDIVGHEVKAVHQMGWATIKNGELLALASQHFDVFVTVDRNLAFPAKSNRLLDCGGRHPEDRLNVIVRRGNLHRSFPRRREPSLCGKAWVPASAGTSGGWLHPIKKRPPRMGAALFRPAMN
jgi:hypothetical protein